MNLYEAMVSLGIVRGGIGVVVILFTLVQISPIKVNPWSWIAKGIGKALNGDIISRLDALEGQIQEVSKEQKTIKGEVEGSRIEAIRRDVLGFATSCHNGTEHTRAEWEHVITQMDMYEKYIEDNKLKNGVFGSEDKYLRSLFDERLKKNDFL